MAVEPAIAPARSAAGGPDPAGKGNNQLDLSEAAGRAVDEVLDRLGSSAGGLTTAEARNRFGAVGSNAIDQRQVTGWNILVSQLRNPLLVLLLAAAAVSGLTGDPTGAAIIGVIVALSVGLGFVNEYRSAQALAALHGDIHYQSLAWRDGTARRVEVTELVPGDVIELRVGDVVPADLRVIEATGLECDESVLTGESMATVKSTAPALDAGSTVESPSCAYMGTVVHQGSGRGVVVATGMVTEFGKIAVGLGEHRADTAFGEPARLSGTPSRRVR